MLYFSSSSLKESRSVMLCNDSIVHSEPRLVYKICKRGQLVVWPNYTFILVYLYLYTYTCILVNKICKKGQLVVLPNYTCRKLLHLSTLVRGSFHQEFFLVLIKLDSSQPESSSTPSKPPK